LGVRKIQTFSNLRWGALAAENDLAYAASLIESRTICDIGTKDQRGHHTDRDIGLTSRAFWTTIGLQIRPRFQLRS